MGFLSDIVDTVAGTAGSLIGAGVDVKTGQNAQKRQAGITERQYRHRYQWQMEDMRLAGLNPLLSYKQGAPGMPGVGGYSSDYSGAVTRGVSSAASAKQASTARRVGEAQVGALNAQAEASKQAALLSNSAAEVNRIQALLSGPDVIGTKELIDRMGDPHGIGANLAMINRIRVLLGLGRGGR
jgi:hypothetical protein